eukprot:365832-Chlamydomonas_euryale.AAC.4
MAPTPPGGPREPAAVAGKDRNGADARGERTVVEAAARRGTTARDGTAQEKEGAAQLRELFCLRVAACYAVRLPRGFCLLAFGWSAQAGQRLRPRGRAAVPGIACFTAASSALRLGRRRPHNQAPRKQARKQASKQASERASKRAGMLGAHLNRWRVPPVSSRGERNCVGSLSRGAHACAVCSWWASGRCVPLAPSQGRVITGPPPPTPSPRMRGRQCPNTSAFPSMRRGGVRKIALQACSCGIAARAARSATVRLDQIGG